MLLSILWIREIIRALLFLLLVPLLLVLSPNILPLLAIYLQCAWFDSVLSTLAFFEPLISLTFLSCILILLTLSCTLLAARFFSHASLVVFLPWIVFGRVKTTCGFYVASSKIASFFSQHNLALFWLYLVFTTLYNTLSCFLSAQPLQAAQPQANRFCK